MLSGISQVILVIFIILGLMPQVYQVESNLLLDGVEHLLSNKGALEELMPMMESLGQKLVLMPLASSLPPMKTAREIFPP
jgi:hypothetical protein